VKAGRTRWQLKKEQQEKVSSPRRSRGQYVKVYSLPVTIGRIELMRESAEASFGWRKKRPSAGELEFKAGAAAAFLRGTHDSILSVVFPEVAVP